MNDNTKPGSVESELERHLRQANAALEKTVNETLDAYQRRGVEHQAELNAKDETIADLNDQAIDYSAHIRQLESDAFVGKGKRGTMRALGIATCAALLAAAVVGAVVWAISPAATSLADRQATELRLKGLDSSVAQVNTNSAKIAGSVTTLSDSVTSLTRAVERSSAATKALEEKVVTKDDLDQALNPIHDKVGLLEGKVASLETKIEQAKFAAATPQATTPAPTASAEAPKAAVETPKETRSPSEIRADEVAVQKAAWQKCNIDCRVARVRALCPAATMPLDPQAKALIMSYESPDKFEADATDRCSAATAKFGARATPTAMVATPMGPVPAPTTPIQTAQAGPQQLNDEQLDLLQRRAMEVQGELPALTKRSVFAPGVRQKLDPRCRMIEKRDERTKMVFVRQICPSGTIERMGQ